MPDAFALEQHTGRHRKRGPCVELSAIFPAYTNPCAVWQRVDLFYGFYVFHAGQPTNALARPPEGTEV